MSMRRAAPGDDPGRAPPKIEIAPPYMVGAFYIYNGVRGIIPHMILSGVLTFWRPLIFIFLPIIYYFLPI